MPLQHCAYSQLPLQWPQAKAVYGYSKSRTKLHFALNLELPIAMTCLVCDVCLCCKKNLSDLQRCKPCFFSPIIPEVCLSAAIACATMQASLIQVKKQINIYIYIFIYMFFYFVYLRNSVFMDDLVKVFCRSIVYDMGHCMCRFFKLTPYLRSAWHASALSWHLTQDHSDFHEAELRLSHQATL